MSIQFLGSTSSQPECPSHSSGNDNSDAGSFECHICLDLAQDPIVTLCGHLFCWPCLYKWLHHHSRSRECPVCKALIEEQKLVPLYGRGNTSTGPRSKTYPETNNPHRPAGHRQRRETASPPQPNHIPQHGFEFTGFSGLGFRLGGVAAIPSARMGNFTLSGAFGGRFRLLFNFQLDGFPDPSRYGSAAGHHYGFRYSFRNGGAHVYPQRSGQGQLDYMLMILLFLISFFVVTAFIWQ